MNKSATPAHAALAAPLGGAGLLRVDGHACALRLDGHRQGILLGRAGFIDSF